MNVACQHELMGRQAVRHFLKVTLFGGAAPMGALGRGDTFRYVEKTPARTPMEFIGAKTPSRNDLNLILLFFLSFLIL